MRIILDTDIGTNADDAVALALALHSPEIRIEGITTVYGKVRTRALIAQKVLNLCGAGHIPVYPGIELPLLRNRPLLRAGIEGKGMQLQDSGSKLDRHAVDFIVQTVMEHPGEITLVMIGPHTNVATAMIREPRIAERVKQIVMMGGVTRLAPNGSDLSPVEHNIQCDPEAAGVVFSSGAPILMLGLDVTRQAVFTRAEADRMGTSGTPLTGTLVRMMHDFMDYMERDFSYMCDPLAIAVLLDPTLIRTKRMNIRVLYERGDFSGQTIAEANSDGNVETALEMDTARFFELLNQRLFSRDTPLL
ncbi:nucleoside hydrolase [Paenibacillus medicaginis]|uniref:Nucleoside hydrolase n=1 Tax=Paenibacillus medicaginis TaxID=1470560 RepID=A0ABV5C2X4_9BACL